MDWLISKGRISLPEGVIYEDGILQDLTINRKIPTNGTGALILQRIPPGGVPFATLIGELAAEFRIDLLRIADDVAPFIKGLNERHLVNIDLPASAYARYLWHVTFGRVLGAKSGWFPTKRYGLMTDGRLRVGRIVTAVPPFFWLLTAGAVFMVAMQMATFFSLEQVVTLILAMSVSIIASFVVHELGHVFAILLLSRGREGSYLVRTSLRFFTVHRAGSTLHEILIGLAGPALAVTAGYLVELLIQQLDDTFWPMLTLPFKLQIAAFLPGFGDADRLWSKAAALFKQFFRRLKSSGS